MQLNALDEQMLIGRAAEARDHSYARYSDFAVGAALLCRDGRIFALGSDLHGAKNGCMKNFEKARKMS